MLFCLLEDGAPTVSTSSEINAISRHIAMLAGHRMNCFVGPECRSDCTRSAPEVIEWNVPFRASWAL